MLSLIFFLDRKPFSDDAAKILSLCESYQITGYVTPVICSNIYYLLKKTSSHEKVVEKLSQLLSFIEILQMDKTVVIEALNSNFKDFEDALQNFSATKAGYIDAIITRNTKDFVKSKIGVHSPEMFLKSHNTDH